MQVNGVVMRSYQNVLARAFFASALVGCGGVDPVDTAPEPIGGGTGTTDIDGDGSPDAVDCNSEDPAVYPGALEHCDGVDQDCNGLIDDEPEDGFDELTDADADGFGVATGSRVCTATTDSVIVGDCDDSEVGVYPGQTVLGRDGCEGFGSGLEWTGLFVNGSAGDTVEDVTGLWGSEALLGVADPEAEGERGAVYIVPILENNGVRSLSEASLTLTGFEAGDKVGYDLALVHDIDADGVIDLAIGGPHARRDGVAVGAVYLFSGSTTGVWSIQDLAWGVVFGDAEGDSLGSVAVTGDASGDAKPDLVVGGTTAGSGAGVAAVFTEPPTLAGETVSVGASLIIYGTHGGALGRVGEGGDFNGDGIVEIVIGADHDNFAGNSAGAVFVGDGALSGVLLDVDLDTALNGSAGSLTAHAVGSAGDLDGDGRDDLVVGAPYEDSNGVESGTAYVVSGPVPVGTGVLANAATATLLGEAAYGHTGFAVGLGGDLSGDDVPDLLVGVKLDSTYLEKAGAVLVARGPFLGTTGSRDNAFKFVGRAVHESIGESTSLPDVDGDGYREIGFGVRESSTSFPSAGSALVLVGAQF